MNASEKVLTAAKEIDEVLKSGLIDSNMFEKLYRIMNSLCLYSAMLRPSDNDERELPSNVLDFKRKG